MVDAHGRSVDAQGRGASRGGVVPGAGSFLGLADLVKPLLLAPSRLWIIRSAARRWGLAFEFPFWGTFIFCLKRIRTPCPSFPPLCFFYFLTQSSAQHGGVHKRHGIRCRGIAKEAAFLRLEELNGGSRAPRLALTGTGGAEAYHSRGVEASLSRPRFIITYRNCCHLPAICNRQVEDWLPTGFPSACCRGYRRLWGRAPFAWSTCTHANPPLSCRGILISPTYTGRRWPVFIL